MAIVQISKIQHRTGANIDLPQLDIGEIGFATDTKLAYIGNDPLIDPPQGISPSVTQIYTNSANCKINASQLTGVFDTSIGNIKIEGGYNGYVLQTDGAGNLSWTAQTGGGGGGGSVAGSNTQVQFANAGYFGGSPGFTYDYTTQNLYVGGNISTAELTSTGNITGANANLGNLVTANYFSGSGANLFAIPASNVVGQVGNSALAATVYSSAQPNITSVGSLVGLTVSNSAGSINFVNTANVNLGSVSNLHISGGLQNYVLSTDGYGNLAWIQPPSTSSGGTPGGLNSQIQFNKLGVFGGDSSLTFDSASKVLSVTNGISTGNLTGVLTTAAQPNVTSLGTLTALNTTGNVTGNYIIGNGSHLSYIAGANVTGFVANANVANSVLSIAGANVTGQVANALIAGTVYTPGQPAITSVGTLTSLNVSGNITTSGYFVGDGSHLTNLPPATVSSISGSAVSGPVASATHASSADSASSSTLAVTVSGNVQANITSVGTLSTLTVSGAIGIGGAVTAGSSITAVGDITAFYNSSDIRLKENLVPIDNALDKVLELAGYYYNYKGKNDKLVGVLAGDVLKVLPQATYQFTPPGVPENKEDPYLAVRYELLVPLLIEAVKTLSDQVNELKASNK